MGDEADAFPSDIARAAAELGPPETLYEVRTRWFRARLVAGVALFGGGLVANALWFGFGPGRKGVFEPHLLITPLVAGGGLLLHMIRNRGLAVLVYPTGLLRLRRGEVASMRWDDVASVTVHGDLSGPPVRTEEACWLPVKSPRVQLWMAWLHLKHADESELKLTPALAEYPELAERAQRETFPRLYAAALAELAAGRAVPFGAKWSLVPEGFQVGAAVLAWADIREVQFKHKLIHVYRRGPRRWMPWHASALALLPNPHVFYAIVASRMTPDAT